MDNGYVDRGETHEAPQGMGVWDGIQGDADMGAAG
jgi:hypothetical protein